MRPGAARYIPPVAAIATLAVHLLANSHYGFFRDELYFAICGFRPAWGYVDQPPVVPLLAAGSQIFGHSLFLMRAIPALFAAASVYTTCLLALELGGGAFAEFFSALVAALTPVLMDFGSKLTTDVVGLWLWPLCALYALRIVKGGDPRLWLAVGAILGVAIQSKDSALFFGAAMVVALAVLPQRRALFTPWFAGGVLVTALLVAPNLLWQRAHDYPIWTLLRDAGRYKDTVLSPLQYAGSQILITHPLLAPVWLIGLVALLRNRDARFLGIGYLLLIVQMMALHGKHYYAGDVYPITIAAGAVAIEAWTVRSAAWRPILSAYVLAAGIVLVPLLMPVLPERAMSDYDRIATTAFWREVDLARAERTQIGNLPPDWADMHGWAELTNAVARVYDSLPPARRAGAAIFASNYGEAAAIDFFGAQYGLPPALSGHNQYWLWGTRGYSGDVIIDVHGECRIGAARFRDRRIAARFSNPWGRPFENGFAISVCEGIATPLSTVWPTLRNYI